MNWVDIGLAIVLLVGGVLGAISGLLWQVARLLIFAIAMYMTLYFHEPVGAWLATKMTTTSPAVLKGLAYFVTFTGTYLVLFLITVLIEKAVKAVELKPVDRVLGAALGAFKAALVCGVVLMGIVVVPIQSLQPDVEASTLGPPVLAFTRALILAVPEEQKQKITEWFEQAKQRAQLQAEDAAKKAAADAMTRGLDGSQPPANAPGNTPGAPIDGTPPPGK